MSNEDKYKAQSIYEEVVKTVMLYKDFTDEELEAFFDAIDFEYSGWEVHTVPKIPQRGQRLNLCL